jgi:hypothetical protein
VKITVFLVVVVISVVLALSAGSAGSSATVDVTVVITPVVRLTGSTVKSNLPVEVLEDDRFFTVVPL